MIVVCCQVEVSAGDQTLAQRSTTECGVSESDHERSVTRKPWLTGCCWAVENKINEFMWSEYNYKINYRHLVQFGTIDVVEYISHRAY
jgi:hypothetical protein